MTHAKLLRSPLPHARIKKITTERAQALPGVIAVVTGRDLEGLDPYYGKLIRDQPLLAIDKVRHIGDVVAGAVAVDEATAYEALSLIDVDYEELKPVSTIWEAMAPEAPNIFESRVSSVPVAYDNSMGGWAEPGNNVLFRFEHGFGDIDAAFERCDRVFNDEFLFSRMSHYHLEPLVTVARADAAGIEIWSNTQDPFEVRGDLARIFKLSVDAVRIHSGLIGGGFGGKSHCKIEPLTVLLARKAGRCVRLAPGMDEAMLSLSQHSAVLRMRTGVSHSGRLIARDCQAWIDAGAYADASAIVASQLGYCLPGPYRWEATRVTVKAVRTTTVPAGSFRGYGRPQATWASESQIDMIARRIGRDPVSMRMAELVERGKPYLPDDTLVDCDLAAGLDRVAAEIEYGKPKRPGEGVGVAVGFKSAGGHGRRSEARVTYRSNGEATVEVGVAEMGQGARVVAARVVAEVLGISLEKVHVLPLDTAVTPFDDGTHACTGVAVTSRAVELAARNVADQVAAGINLPEIVGFCRHQNEAKPMNKFGSNPLYWQPAWAAARVEVDADLGTIRLKKLVVAADAGRAIDMTKCHGQVFGGAMQGLGQALFESLRFERSQPLNASPRSYRLPLCSDLPDEFLSVVFETGGGPGPFGSKGIGEAGIMPVAAAIANAIDDAMGVRLTTLPMTAEAVCLALHGAVGPTHSN